MMVPVEVHLDVECDVPFIDTWRSVVEAVVRMVSWEGFWGGMVGWVLLSLPLLSSPAIWCLLFICILSPPLFMCDLLTAFFFFSLKSRHGSDAFFFLF